MPSAMWSKSPMELMTNLSHYKRKLIGGGAAVQLPRTRQLKKGFQNFLLTAVCGITTILVLKGSTGFQSPASFNYESQDQMFHAFANREHPLLRPRNPKSENLHVLTNHDRPFPNSAFLTDQVRPLHKLQKPPSQIPSLPTDNDQASSSQSSILEPQRTRLLAEVNNLIPEKDKNPIHSNNPHANPTIHPNPNAHTGSSHEKPHQRSKASELHQPDDPKPSISDSHQRSILLVTGSQPSACDSPMGDYYLMKSLKNKMDYCRLHNIDIFYNLALLDPQMSGFWAKLPVLHTLMLAHPEKEWLWWVDSDAMITDMTFELPMDRYKDYNFVVPGWKDLVYEEKDWVGLNTGSFLIRNCEWSLRLLEAWAPMGTKGKVREEAGRVLTKALVGRPDFEADDQSGLIYLLNEQKSKWDSKVYFESAYYLHGYWLIIVDRYEEMMEKYHAGLGDERWHFVTHFVGCKPCKSEDNKLGTQSKCFEQMERAFNFADNQVLQSYGFQHETLSTHKVLASASSS